MYKLNKLNTDIYFFKLQCRLLSKCSCSAVNTLWYFWGWRAPIQFTLCPINSLISSILVYGTLVKPYNIVTIATRWKSFSMKISFIGDLDHLERIRGFWPLSWRCLWPLLYLLNSNRITTSLAAGDYDPGRGKRGLSPLYAMQCQFVDLTCANILSSTPFIPQSRNCVLFVALGLGSLM